MKIANQQLKAFIEDADLVKGADLERAYSEAESKNKVLTDVLLELKLLKDEQVIQLKAYIAGIPFVDLSNMKIDPDVLRIIPEPLARKNNIIAYKKTENDLEVAMLDPQDLQTIDFIRKKAGLKIKPRLTTPKGIQHALEQYEESLQKEFENLAQGADENVTVKSAGKVKLKLSETNADVLKKQAEEVSIVKIVDSVLHHAVLQRASDIHVEPGERELIIRYRIDGILHDAMVLPRNVHDGIVARIKILSNLRLDEHRLPQDGRFTITSDSYKVSLRVSIIPVFDGEKVVLRLLRENAEGFTLETLGFRPEQIDILHRAVRKPTGMLLATGPTGSGKTTTLYTLMDIVNVPGVNISTIEDPIEYRMPRVNQTQVQPKIGLNFANGLRALVRQDPDIIMVGEIRDNETAGLAINAALTGHLVLSTLHTNNAAGALPRLLDMEQEPFLIASTVNTIIAQRLVRRLCQDSAQPYKLTSKDIQRFSQEVNMEHALEVLKHERIIKPSDTWQTVTFYKAKSNDECPDGYKGRIGIHEVLEVTESIRRLITENATSDEIYTQAQKEGMITMLEDGFIKAVQGITTLEEVLRVTSE